MIKEKVTGKEDAESLLARIDAYLEKALSEEADLEKAKPFEGKETAEEEALEEKAPKKEKEKKSMTTKAEEDEDYEDKEEEDEDDEELKKPAKKAAKKACKKADEEEEVEKSFEASEEYKEYQVLKKAKQEEEMRKAEEEKEFLKKSLSDLMETVTGLKNQVADLSKQPASLPRSMDGLKVLEKANPEGVKLTDAGLVEDKEGVDVNMPKKLFKAKVANVMFEKGVLESKKLTTTDIAEYESTGYIVDPAKRKFVKSLVEKSIKDGEF